MQIARRRHRVARTGLDLAKGMQLRRPRCWPNSRSHASDPIPITQERFPSMSRKPTARNNPGSSPQNERTAARAALPGLTVTTRKIAARVKAPTTDWGTGRLAGMADRARSLDLHASCPVKKRHTRCPRSLSRLQDFSRGLARVHGLIRGGPRKQRVGLPRDPIGHEALRLAHGGIRAPRAIARDLRQ